MRAFLILLRKELLDLSRDRRALMLTLVLPVLLYPGLLAVMGVLVSAGKERLQREPLVVATVTKDAAALLGQRPPPPLTTYRALSRVEAEAQLKERQVAALVDVPEGSLAGLGQGRQVVVTVGYSKRHDTSMEALDRLRPLLGSLNDEALQGRLRAQALEVAFVTPVRTDAQDLDFQKDLGPFIASRLLPLILLVMLGAGAVYPAVDLTAGEKERGTLETLLVSGASVNQVMAAKYATVALAAIASALANLVAMGITFASGLSFTGEAVTVHFTVAQLLVMLACLLPAALLLAGLSLALASTARTFKEGQSLMTPLLLVVMAPGFLAQMPGMELSTATALVPLLDVALLVKAVVLGTARPVEVLLTVAVVLACAGGSVLLAASAFRSETFRFGGEKGVK